VIHLADAVGELLRQRTMRVHPLPGAPERFYTARAPGLLEQLGQAVGNSTGTHSHTVPGPRLPISADAFDLWYAIVTSLHAWADELGVQRCMPAPVLLRKVSAAAVARDEIAATLQRRCWCGQAAIEPTDCGRCWVHRIEALLAPQLVDRELRGAACTACRTETEQVDPETGKITIIRVPTTTTLIERDGELYRVPAIVVRVASAPWAEGADTDLWVYRMCRACGTEGWLDYSTSTAA